VPVLSFLQNCWLLLLEELLADSYHFYSLRERLNAFLETSDSILDVLSAKLPVFPIKGGE